MPCCFPRRAGLPALALLLAATAGAQGPPSTAPSRQPVRAELFTGGELESYLRTLQILGTVADYPWSMRGFSRPEVDALLPRTADHPWAERYDLTRGDSAAERARRDGAQLLRPSLALRHNTGFPFGSNDGAVWAGRGLTTAIRVGAAARWGPLSLTLAPIAFRAENSDVPLRPNGLAGRLQFAHDRFPMEVDQPRRFGDGAYQRLDPGQSTLRLDLLGATAGISSANVWWGPADRFPFLLGTNAPGFVHVFLGTERPADIRIGRLHGRVLWGRLEQSGYFDVARAAEVTRPGRFAAGLLLLFEPEVLPGLEVGAARFFHAPWPDEGLPGRYLWRPFQPMTKQSLDEEPQSIPGDRYSRDGENQLASVFARWRHARSGFELYAELGRDDHNGDVRDLLLEPDHQASVLWGVRKAWRRGGSQLVALRLESMNYERNDPSNVRGGGRIYAHSAGSNQGHTHYGQLLGADAGVGSGAGAELAVDWYRPDGRWTVGWTRVVRGRQEVWHPPAPEPIPRAVDVLHSLDVERLLFRGPWDVTAGLSWAYNFDREFVRDRQNVSVHVAVTGLPW